VNRKQETDKRSAFYDLLVWQKAMRFAKLVYIVTSKLPNSEEYGITSQIRRSAVSIPSNIAEGSRRGKKEFAQFLRIANASAAEAETQLLLIQDIYGVDVAECLDVLVEIEKMLEAFIKKLQP